MLKYHEPLFRPPSEARSLIFQIAMGCSHNKCTFCYMYKTKKFLIKPWEELYQEIVEAGKEYPYMKRGFLADGDPLVLETSYLLQILETLYRQIPALERVSIYALPKTYWEKAPMSSKNSEMRDSTSFT